MRNYSGYRIHAAVLFFIVSTLFFFSGIFFGLDFTDSFFHLNQAKNSGSDNYLYPFLLSTISLEIILDYVGEDLIIFRFIHSLLLILSISIPFLVIRPKISVSKILFISGLVMIAFAPLNFGILSYDTFSTFTLSIIFSIIILYWKTRKLYLVVLVSLITGIAVLFRFPNVLLIPVIFLLLPGKNNRFTVSFFFVSFTLLAVACGYLLHYKNFNSFLSSSVVFSGNDFKEMIIRYLNDGIKLFCFVIFLLLNYGLYEKTENSRNQVFFNILPFILLCGFIVCFVIFSKYAMNYSLLLTSVALSYVIVKSFKSTSKPNHFRILLLFAAFMIIYPVGSNTGLYKACSLFLLFPFLYCRTSSVVRNYWILIIIFLIPFSFLEKVRMTYEDKNIFTLNKTLDLPLLNPIRTTQSRNDFLLKVDSLVQDLQEQGIQVYFYGNKSHIFNYLYPGSDLDLQSFYQPIDDLRFFSDIEEKISSRGSTAIFVIDDYPERDSNKNTSLLEDELQDLGFRKSEKGEVVYYLK